MGETRRWHSDGDGSPGSRGCGTHRVLDFRAVTRLRGHAGTRELGRGKRTRRCHFGAAFTRAACDRLALSVDHMDEVDNVDGEWTAWTLMT